MQIREDDLAGEAIQALLRQHLEHMFRASPPESVHALDLESLRRPEITFWSAWDGETLLGCGALRELARQCGEIKSMRTAEAHRGRGVAKELLAFILEEARRRNYTTLLLETGSQPDFEPARRLYAGSGFTERGPFGDYEPDPNSVFMQLEL